MKRNINITMDADLLHQLQEVAAKEKQSLSSILRVASRKFVSGFNKPTADPLPTAALGKRQRIGGLRMSEKQQDIVKVCPIPEGLINWGYPEFKLENLKVNPMESVPSAMAQSDGDASSSDSPSIENSDSSLQ